MTKTMFIRSKEYPYNIIDFLMAKRNITQEYPEDVLDGYEVMLNHLDLRERHVIEYRWKDKMTLEEVGKIFKRSKERIREHEEHAIRIMCNQRWFRYIQYGKKKIDELSEAKGDSLLDKDLNFLELSVRTYNCLMRRGYTTIQKVVDAYKSKVLMFEDIRNFGKDSFKEISNRLLELKLIDYELFHPEELTGFRIRELNISNESKTILLFGDMMFVKDIKRYIIKNDRDFTSLFEIDGMARSNFEEIMNELERLGIKEMINRRDEDDV